jgi:hypothetical protein
MCQTESMPWKDTVAAAEHAKSMRTGTPLECSYCHQSFYRSPSNRARGKPYCSRVCMGAAFVGRFVGAKSPRFRGNVETLCGHCAKAIVRPRWSAGDRKRTFCDRKCFGAWRSINWCANGNPAWRGGSAKYYGANWRRQAREARRRDGHACRRCGIAESLLRHALDVHHIRPFRFYKVARYREANALENLVSLCDGCHKHVERWSDSGTVKDWETLRRKARLGGPPALP